MPPGISGHPPPFLPTSFKRNTPPAPPTPPRLHLAPQYSKSLGLGWQTLWEQIWEGFSEPQARRRGMRSQKRKGNRKQEAGIQLTLKIPSPRNLRRGFCLGHRIQAPGPHQLTYTYTHTHTHTHTHAHTHARTCSQALSPSLCLHPHMCLYLKDIEG